MRLRPLLLGILVGTAAVSMSRALATRDGVGPLEYVAGIALVGVLAVITFRAMRRATHRT